MEIKKAESGLHSAQSVGVQSSSKALTFDQYSLRTTTDGWEIHETTNNVSGFGKKQGNKKVRTSAHTGRRGSSKALTFDQYSLRTITEGWEIYNTSMLAVMCLVLKRRGK